MGRKWGYNDGKSVHETTAGFHRHIRKGGQYMDGYSFAYMRISTTKATQKTDRQRKTISDYAAANGIELPEENYYEDTITGGSKADSRPNYHELKGRLRKGDLLIVSDVDRLGRNADDVIVEMKELKMKGVRVIALDVPFMNDYSKMCDDSLSEMIVDIFITLKAHLAQQEKEKNHARVMQGLNTAKAKGVKLGRPPVEVSRDFVSEYNKFKNGEYGKITATQFAKLQGMGRSTLYKYVKILEEDALIR